MKSLALWLAGVWIQVFCSVFFAATGHISLSDFFCGAKKVSKRVLVSLRDPTPISALSLQCYFLEAESLSMPCCLCSSPYTHYWLLSDRKYCAAWTFSLM